MRGSPTNCARPQGMIDPRKHNAEQGAAPDGYSAGAPLGAGEL